VKELYIKVTECSDIYVANTLPVTVMEALKDITVFLCFYYRKWDNKADLPVISKEVKNGWTERS